MAEFYDQDEICMSEAVRELRIVARWFHLHRRPMSLVTFGVCVVWLMFAIT